MILLTLSVVLTLVVQGFRSGTLSIRRLLLGTVGLVLMAALVVNSSSTIHKFWQRAVSDTRISLDIDNYQNWNVTKKGIYITFDPYQVASYAEGPKHVIVPFSALKDMLKPDSPLAPLMSKG